MKKQEIVFEYNQYLKIENYSERYYQLYFSRLALHSRE